MLKQTAKQRLKGKFAESNVLILTVFSVYLIFIIAEFFLIRMLGNVAAWFITGAFAAIHVALIWSLELGMTRYFYKLALLKSCGWFDMFSFFSSAGVFFSGLAARLISFIWTALPGVFIVFPGSLLLSFFSSAEAYTFGEAAHIAGLIIGIFLIFAGVFLMIRARLGQFLVPFLLCAPGHRNPFKIVRQSIRLMKKSRADLFWLIVSFFGWFLLCLFIFPAFYALPYYQTAISLFATKKIKPRM